jgi:hypothetical protein
MAKGGRPRIPDRANLAGIVFVLPVGGLIALSRRVGSPTLRVVSPGTDRGE